MKTGRSFYKDISAVKVETERLALTFLPEHGGKCASIRDKKSGREFLSQAPGERYKKLVYDGDYAAAECSGFDDMFPAVDRYYYDRHPWQGVPVPDHGEVCGLEWKYETKKDALRIWTHSPRFGYKFEKTVSETKDGISIDYTVTNNTQFPLDFVYAAHCMVAAETGGVVVLPGVPDGEKASLVFSSNGKRGRYGSPFIWSGKAKNMVVTPAPSKKKDGSSKAETFKFFFDAPCTGGCCEYRYPDGVVFSLSYSADKLPYLGIWINWRDFHDLCNVAFEPSSGTFDRPDVARMRGQFSVLKPYAKYEWNVNFAVRNG
ncbi:MAG: hypothetical protein LBI67_10580 [Treponema sp.]|jgi:hypothetical protein|nr:hypothetical protein [Treponema sp.]